MTPTDIYTWCMDRQNIKAHHDFSERGNTSIHIVKYETGEVYEYIEKELDFTHKQTETKINGETVHRATFEWYNFGWREAR